MGWIILIIAIAVVFFGAWGGASRQKWLEDLANKNKNKDKYKEEPPLFLVFVNFFICEFILLKIINQGIFLCFFFYQNSSEETSLLFLPYLHSSTLLLFTLSFKLPLNYLNGSLHLRQ